MKRSHKFWAILFIALLPVIGTSVFASTEKFDKAHKESFKLDKDTVFKKILFCCGLINAAYLGINDQVAALQLAKKNSNPGALSAQLLAVQIGLVEKPFLIRFIAHEIELCQNYPNFPLGFNDSPEGPEKMSAEFYKIADHIENMKIKFESNDIKALRKESERVVFELFWTDSEKMRTLCSDMLNFIRKELKEDLPFDVFSKQNKPKVN